MKWTAAVVDGALVGQPTGKIDESTWEAFLAKMMGAVAQAADAGQRFVLDLGGIEYMSSRGLRALNMARQEAVSRKISMQLANPQPFMAEILAISRFDKIFQVVGVPGATG